MAAAQEIYKEQADDEATALRSDEQTPWLDESLKALAHPDWFSDLDRLQIIRGYSTYKNRQEDTTKCFTDMEAWRAKIDYPNLLDELLPKAENFHNKVWVDTVYGADKFGHIILGFSLPNIDIAAIEGEEEEMLERLIGQKLKVLQKYKLEQSKKTGVQRYKATMIIDAKGIGAGFAMGKRRGIIQKIMNIGSEFFPETVWKIYVYNTGFFFSALWALAKKFIHPITKAKIRICGKPEEVGTQLAEVDGVPTDQIPKCVGGPMEGTNMFKLMQEMVALTKSEKESTAAVPPATTML